MGSVTAIDLNADLGETVDGMPTADDEAMFAVISSASIACGGHAGDAASMREAVDRAERFGVAVGAHPSYPDRGNFGRVAVAMEASALAETVGQQLDRLHLAGADLRYVKPHGALYHAVTGTGSRRMPSPAPSPNSRRGSAGRCRCWAFPARSRRLRHPSACRSCTRRSSTAATCPTARSCRVDRPDALLDDPQLVAARAVRLAREGVVEAIDGTLVPADAASLCVHGDSPAAVAMARAVRAALDDAERRGAGAVVNMPHPIRGAGSPRRAAC